jgi:hypothetical protein
MPTHPAARAALAAMVLDAAPLIASALAEVGHPYGVRIQYSTSGVRVTATTPALMDEAFNALLPAFDAAGWGMHCSYTDDFATRSSVSFQPPYLLTQTGAPVEPFPPR